MVANIINDVNSDSSGDDNDEKKASTASLDTQSGITCSHKQSPNTNIMVIVVILIVVPMLGLALLSLPLDELHD